MDRGCRASGERGLIPVCESGGRSRLRSSQVQGQTLRISFTDNGPGVPADLQDQIFDPFFTTASLGDGMGLGLSVAYGVVQDHGGRMWLESAEGAGAAIFIELPLDEA